MTLTKSHEREVTDGVVPDADLHFHRFKSGSLDYHSSFHTKPQMCPQRLRETSLPRDDFNGGHEPVGNNGHSQEHITDDEEVNKATKRSIAGI